MLDEVETAYTVDPNRVYLTGLSMGGYGTWSLACHQAERFAAIAPICGGGPWYLADRLKHTPVWAFHGDADGTVRGAVLVFSDVTQIRGLEREMAYLASHDPLTGLINRREFEQRLNAAILAAGQHGRRYALGYLDLDDFKIVNEARQIKKQAEDDTEDPPIGDS